MWQQKPTFTNQVDSFWSLFAQGRYGILAGFIILAIIFAVFWLAISILARIFGFVPLIAGLFAFLMVWLAWSAMDTDARRQWGIYLWGAPFLIWIIGAIGKATGIIASMELAFADTNRIYTMNLEMGSGMATMQVSLIAIITIVLLVIVATLAILFREDLA